MDTEVSPLFIFMVLSGLSAAALVVVRVVRIFPALSYSLTLIYLVVSTFISLIYIDTFTVFISEAAIVSSPTGAPLRFAILNIAVLGGLLLGVRVRAKRPQKIVLPDKLELYAASLLVVGVTLLELANLALSRSTAFPFGAATRYDFWDVYAFAPILETIFGTIAIFIPFMASAIFVYASEQGNVQLRNVMVVTLAGYFIYLLGIGQVFHGHLVPAAIIFGTYMVWKVVKGQRIVQPRVAIAVIAFAALASIVSVNNIGQRGIGQGGALQGTAYRLLVVQGGIVWRTDDLRQSGIRGEFSDLVDGRQFLIYTILPPSLASRYDERGVNLQGALPSSAYLVVGFWAAMLISFIYGILSSLVMRMVVWMFVTGQPLLLFVGSHIWLWTSSAYARSSFDTILRPEYFIAWGIVIIWPLARSLVTKRHSLSLAASGAGPELTRR